MMKICTHTIIDNRNALTYCIMNWRFVVYACFFVCDLVTFDSVWQLIDLMIVSAYESQLLK